MELANLLSISTGALYMVPIGLAVYQRDWHPLTGLAGFLATLVTGEGLKHGVIGQRSVRPQGARDCDAWCRGGPAEGRPGMPSTHTAFAAFFAVFYGASQSMLVQMMFAMYVVAIAWSRLMKRCHTEGQVIAGALLGGIIALVMLRVRV